MSREFRATFNEEYEIYKKYQIAIHHDDPSEVNEKQVRFWFERFVCLRPF